MDIVKYHFDSAKDNVPVNAAISKANSMMHDMEIDILEQMVNSGTLEPDHMLIVDGPLQFIRQDTGKPEFADMFYNVVGVSGSFVAKGIPCICKAEGNKFYAWQTQHRRN